MNSSEKFDLIVVGGGITGLATAYIASKTGKKVLILEAESSVGGLLHTFEVEQTRLEYYYHHFFMHDAELNWLIKDLGIQDKLYFKKTSMGVFTNGKIYDFNSPIDLLKFSPIHFFDKIRFGLTSIFMGKIANWKKFESISAFSWLNKWAGKSTSKSLWNPLLTIKFGPYASQVPMSWMIGRMRQRMNSRKSGDEQLGYIDGSLQVLLDAILEKLQQNNVTILTNCPIEQVSVADNKIQTIQTSHGEFIGNKVVFTIPNHYISKVLQPFAPDYCNKLNQVQYFGAVCVILELHKPLSSIYWLNISDEGYPFGGIIEHTNFIPAEKYNNTHIVYLSRYFAKEEAIAHMTVQEIEKEMIGFLPKINPEFNESWIKKVSTFKTNTAATVCDLNFSSKVPTCKTPLDNAFVANMSHVYPDERSTNNSIRIAAEACKIMEIPSEFVPKHASLSGGIGF